ncbi:MAG: hypothetical protein GXP55_01010, partial [Deltaproteobacteria bacterium]|nr:hypothetical protein [Deltaproteobacteria bacterium]
MNCRVLAVLSLLLMLGAGCSISRGGRANLGRRDAAQQDATPQDAGAVDAGPQDAG